MTKRMKDGEEVVMHIEKYLTISTAIRIAESHVRQRTLRSKLNVVWEKMPAKSDVIDTFGLEYERINQQIVSELERRDRMIDLYLKRRGRRKAIDCRHLLSCRRCSCTDAWI